MRPGRFDAKIYVPLPDEPARFRLLELYLAKRPLADDVLMSDLARALDGCSGADIKAIAERAATIPFLSAVGGAEPRQGPQGGRLARAVVADQRDDLALLDAHVEAVQGADSAVGDMQTAYFQQRHIRFQVRTLNEER